MKNEIVFSHKTPEEASIFFEKLKSLITKYEKKSLSEISHKIFDEEIFRMLSLKQQMTLLSYMTGLF